jgi:hypothetical protein
VKRLLRTGNVVPREVAEFYGSKGNVSEDPVVTFRHLPISSVESFKIRPTCCDPNQGVCDAGDHLTVQ